MVKVVFSKKTIPRYLEIAVPSFHRAILQHVRNKASNCIKTGLRDVILSSLDFTITNDNVDIFSGNANMQSAKRKICQAYMNSSNAKE